MKIRLSVIVLPVLTLLLSCVEKFDYTSDNGLDIPYINGYITDEFGFQEIEIGQLIPFSTDPNPLIYDAIVYVEDDLGNIFDFRQMNGKYVSNSAFAAVEGVNYTLTVIIDGIEYKSTPQDLISGPAISGFNYREDSRLSFNRDNDVTTLEGLTISMDMSGSNGNTVYYKTSLSHTFIFEAYRLNPDHPNKRCYINRLPKTFHLHEYRSGDYSYDIEFLEFGREYQHGISFEVLRLAMNKEAYEFWQEIQVQSKNTGSIFDTPPYAIRGNMTSDNRDYQMRGYFGVYSIDTQRLFVFPDDISYEYPSWLDDAECYPPRPFWPEAHCFNCMSSLLSSNVTNQKPNWWP